MGIMSKHITHYIFTVLFLFAFSSESLNQSNDSHYATLEYSGKTTSFDYLSEESNSRIAQKKLKELHQRSKIWLAYADAEKTPFKKVARDDVHKVISTPDELVIRKYFDEHPNLFMKRRVFELQQVAFKKGIEANRVRDILQQSRSYPEFVLSLIRARINHNSYSISTTSENIPADILDDVAALGDGRAVVKEMPAGILVVWRVSSSPEPWSYEEARSFITRTLKDARLRKISIQKPRNLQHT